MRYVAGAVIVSLLSTAAHAQQATCKLQSIEKKLTGAPLTTFMQKCQEDVQKACEQLASARHLEEPAKTLFLNNCVKAFIG
jgi:hypothetical protein